MVQLGSALKQREQQYVASRVEGGAWKILDTWHPSLSTLSVDDDIPDDSPAVTVVSEGAFIALVKEATVRGMVRSGRPGPGEDVGYKGEEANNLEERLLQAREELTTLNLENTKLKEREPETESFRFKHLTLEALMRLALSTDIKDLS